MELETRWGLKHLQFKIKWSKVKIAECYLSCLATGNRHGDRMVNKFYVIYNLNLATGRK